MPGKRDLLERTVHGGRFCSALCLALLMAAAAGRDSRAENEISLARVLPEADLAAWFGSHYERVPVDVQPAIPAYSLPLPPADVQNLQEVAGKVGLSAKGREMLKKNGFVSIRWRQGEDVAAAYSNIKSAEMPVFVTTDSLLHLYHIQFDETLRSIEENEFVPDLIALSRVFQEGLQRRYKASRGAQKEACKKGVAYFSVARKLLEPDAATPRLVRSEVEWELERIEEHEGPPSYETARTKAILAYPEDYSQYVPRGHYTRSKELEQYFKAMMWFGRQTLLLKGHEDHGADSRKPALISREEAEVQTLLAAMIAGLLGELKIDGRLAADVWNRIYAVTAYYVGVADDLGPQDYRSALRTVFGQAFNPEAVEHPDNLRNLQMELVRMRPAAIYGGTGNSTIVLKSDEPLTPDHLDRELSRTMGFRLMGQRYVPDSHILGRLVAPSVSELRGEEGFTTITIGPPQFRRSVRGFPRGLDVMAVLGSDRALGILGRLGDTAYLDYDKRMEELRGQFDAVSESDWNRNLYWSWLYALRGLIEPVRGEGWPTFMTTDAWTDKQINAALGSWSSLRHDTILLVKQSYTPKMIAMSARGPDFPPPKPKPVVGYVEPVPEFYSRLLALTRMSIKGLTELDVLDTSSRRRLQALDRILSRLKEISEKELRNEELEEGDYAFIKDFGDNLSSVVTGADATAQKTTLVADVHTESNSMQVLEEATGPLRLLVAAYKLPQGHILLGVGPVFSYYEFKHPMSDRLTDEKWREFLKSDKAPALPEWTDTFLER